MSTELKLQLQQGYGGRSMVVRREEWGARPAPRRLSLATPVEYVILHHTKGEASTSQPTNSSLVRSLQRQHIDIKGHTDIGYSFLVGEDGRVYEGRGWGVEGEHTEGYNRNSIGIAVIGDFSESVPNDSALDAIRALIAYGAAQGHIKDDYKLRIHRDPDNNNSKDSPGEQFYEEVKSWEHFEE